MIGKNPKCVLISLLGRGEFLFFKAEYTPHTCYMDRKKYPGRAIILLVSGYKWIQLVSGLHVSGVNAALCRHFYFVGGEDVVRTVMFVEGRGVDSAETMSMYVITSSIIL